MLLPHRHSSLSSFCHRPGRRSRRRSAANSVTFTDSAGEDPLAPDILDRRLQRRQRDDHVADQHAEQGDSHRDMLFLLLIDSDSNSGTGENGFDYALELDGPLTGSASVGLALERHGLRRHRRAAVLAHVLVSERPDHQAQPIGARRHRALRLLDDRRLGHRPVPTGEPDFTNIHDAPRSARSYDVKVTPPRLVVRAFGLRPLTPRAGRPLNAFVTFADRSRDPTGADCHLPGDDRWARAAVERLECDRDASLLRVAGPEDGQGQADPRHDHGAGRQAEGFPTLQRTRRRLAVPRRARARPGGRRRRRGTRPAGALGRNGSPPRTSSSSSPPWPSSRASSPARCRVRRWPSRRASASGPRSWATAACGRPSTASETPVPEVLHAAGGGPAHRGLGRE